MEIDADLSKLRFSISQLFFFSGDLMIPFVIVPCGWREKKKRKKFSKELCVSQKRRRLLFPSNLPSKEEEGESTKKVIIKEERAIGPLYKVRPMPILRWVS